MTLIADLQALLGPAHVLTGGDAAPWARDWTGAYHGEPLAVLRPRTTAEVSGVMALAHAARAPVVPAPGRTGLTGATHAPGQLEWQTYGCDKAAKMGIEPDRIVNTMHADDLIAWTAH